MSWNACILKVIICLSEIQVYLASYILSSKPKLVRNNLTKLQLTSWLKYWLLLLRFHNQGSRRTWDTLEKAGLSKKKKIQLLVCGKDLCLLLSEVLKEINVSAAKERIFNLSWPVWRKNRYIYTFVPKENLSAFCQSSSTVKCP